MSNQSEGSTERFAEDGREPTDFQKRALDGMATWALKHGIDFLGFNDDGTIPDTDGAVHESPFVVPSGDAELGREFDGYVECDGCGTTYGWKQKLTLLEDGEPVCSECAEEPEAVAQIIYVSNTHGDSWHRLGQRLSLEAVRSLHTDADQSEDGDRP